MSARYDAIARSVDTTLAGESEERADDGARRSYGQRALDALYRSQAGRLLRMFNRRSDPQDAADLVQEAFTRYADATLERDAKPDCPESYLTQVAVNVMRERGRSPAHRAALSAVPIEDIPLVGPDQGAALEARDMLNRVDAIMMMLKPLTRDIFIARRYHQLSRAEIAAQTGLSLRAVDKQLARGWQHLLHHLGEIDEA